MRTSRTCNGQCGYLLEQTALPIPDPAGAATQRNVPARVDAEGVPTGVGGGAMDALRHP
jgi:hypothetical protein